MIKPNCLRRVFSWSWLKSLNELSYWRNSIIMRNRLFPPNIFLTGVWSINKCGNIQCNNYFSFSHQRGPMVPGIPPREASDRLGIFQARFDELWRKYETYSGKHYRLPVTHSFPVSLSQLYQNQLTKTFHLILKEASVEIDIGHQQSFFWGLLSPGRTLQMSSRFFICHWILVWNSNNGINLWVNRKIHPGVERWRFLRHNADINPTCW